MPEPFVGGVEKPSIPAVETPSEREAFEPADAAQEQFLERPEATAAKARVIEGVPTTPVPVVPVVVAKDDVTLEVERILEEGLGDFYATLPPHAKELFKKKGETASIEISAMVRSLNLKFKRALQLVRDWLLTIPGVNKFFLEQEAKIKVDRLKELVEARRADKTRL